MIRVLFFASLADATGISEMEVEAHDHPDVASILDRCAEEFPRLETRRRHVLCAVNQAFARPETPVSDGDEVAFFPPVSGG